MPTDRIEAGVDEVGRGCLAGPVVAAAVIFPREHMDWMDEIRDSKKLSAKKREKLAALVKEHCIWSVRESSVESVDKENVLNASLNAMFRAVHSVIAQGGKPDVALVDGTHKMPWTDIPQETIKGGDDIHKVIGAASIVAKVHRDNIMVGMDSVYPEYGFAQHKGYGTEQHRQAIMEHGITPIHRKTFKGVSEYV
jgi:ribonuclease HII